MKMARMNIIGVLAAATSLVIPSANAQDTGFYMGVGLGRSVASFNGDDFDSVNVRFRNASIKSTATSDKVYGLLGGYNFNERWAIEAGYVDLGRFAYRWYGPSSGPGPEPGPGSGLYSDNIYSFDYKASAWFAAVKGTLPVVGRLSIFGKLGLTDNKARDTFALDTSRHIEPSLFPCPSGRVCYPLYSDSPIFSKPGSYTKTRTDALIGVGVDYRVLKNASIRFEYEDFGRFGASDNTGRTRITATALTLVYRF